MTDHPVALVSVPADLAGTPAIRNALGLYRSAILCGEQWSDTCRDAYLAALKELDQLAMPTAAPAPSSLAGGDRKQFLCDVLYGVALDGDEPIGETADRILAALSPEAPAREGVDYEIDRSDALTPRQMDALHDAFNRVLAGEHDSDIPIEVFERPYEKIGGMGRRIAALTPRHEAPASEGDV